MVRLQKWLAQAGVASRRACETLIEQGRVKVNGEVAALGRSINPQTDTVTLDGQSLCAPEPATYLMLHKPVGYVTTVRDPQGRPTVMELVESKLRLFPVGRLDRDSSGLLLFTNDGALSQALLHPSKGVWKVYLAGFRGRLTREALAQLQTGVELEDGRTAPCRARLLSDGRVRIELKEGRKRQVRRMLGAVGCPVLDLVRVSFGPLELGALPPGASRPLSAAELQSLERFR